MEMNFFGLQKLCGSEEAKCPETALDKYKEKFQVDVLSAAFRQEHQKLTKKMKDLGTRLKKHASKETEEEQAETESK